MMSAPFSRPVVRFRRLPSSLALLAAGALLATLCPSAASARTVQVKVDARTAPWDRRSNRQLAFGTGDGKRPSTIFGLALFEGMKVRITASGSITWMTGGPRSGPDGDVSLRITRSLELMPYYYMQSGKPIGMGALVGAFVNADGTVIGKPFAIGAATEVTAPAGAAAITLGINDDVYSDNDGSFTVTIDVPEPSVTVEPEREP